MEKQIFDVELYLISANVNKFFKTATVEECFNYLKNKKLISIDIETTKKYNKYGGIEGLDPYTSNIIMFQVGTLEKQFVIDTRNTDISLLLPLLTDKEVVKVGHNIKFEYKHILHKYGIRLKNVYDTQIVEQILYSGYDLKNSLEELCKRYLNLQVDKSTRLGFLNIKDRPFLNKEIEYGAEDIINPLRIKQLQDKQIIDRQLSNCVSLEMLFLLVLGDIEYKGLKFNSDKWLETYEENLILYKELELKLNSYVVNNFYTTKFVDRQLSLFDSDLKCKINWSSPKQVVDFFTYLKICPKEVSKTTKKLTYTVNAKVLKSSLHTINKETSDELKDLLILYISYKERGQECTTFGKDFLKYVNPITNRLHSNYRQILNTGRISSSSPNLQNIPSSEKFRKCFDSSKEFKIINADYSGQETVVLANKSKEENIIKLINTGGDMHKQKTVHIKLDEFRKNPYTRNMDNPEPSLQLNAA